MSEDRIIQIIPAIGWFARYREPNEIIDVPLACWALLDNGQVAGIDAGDLTQIAEDIKTFSCYIHESELMQNPPTGDSDFKEQG